jgi:Undecaprenyl-phosphate galactose phosphotransferase WbaP
MSDADSALRPTIDLTVGARPTFLAHKIGNWASEGPGRRWIVSAGRLCGDAAATLLAIEIARGAQVAFHSPPDFGTLLNYAPLLMPIIYLFLGVYEGWGCGPVERLRLRVYGVVLFLTIEMTAAFALGADHRGVLTFVGIFAPCALVLSYYGEVLLLALFFRRGLWGARVAVAGDDKASRELADALLARPELGLRPVGFVELAKVGAQSDLRLALIPLCSSDVAPPSSRHIDLLVFASAADMADSELTRGWGRLPISRIAVAPQVQDIESLRLRTRTLRGVFGKEVNRELYAPHNLFVKRLLDRAIAIPVAVVALPIVVILALAIRIVDPGPAFYMQSRVGINGRNVRVFKLRTMRANAEARLADHLARSPAARAEWERHFKLVDDPRIIPIIGKFIRRSSLDELPQLLNIIRGDMSLVGPRPFPGYHMKAFDEGFQALRTSVPPGLTGLWQVSSRSDGDVDAQRTQDTQYIQNWSIWLDLYILLQTVPAVLNAKGAQ